MSGVIMGADPILWRAMLLDPALKKAAEAIPEAMETIDAHCAFCGRAVLLSRSGARIASELPPVCMWCGMQDDPEAIEKLNLEFELAKAKLGLRL